MRPKLFALALSCATAAAVVESCSDDPAVSSAPDAAAPQNDVAEIPLGDGGLNEAAVYLGVGAVCDASAACGPGLGCCEQCCLAGKPAICTRLVDGGSGATCPLPDLVVNEKELENRVVIETIEAGACEMEEACLLDAGLRKVLRFDARIGNIGPADLLFGSPEAGTAFHYAACHMHYHFDDFAKYTLYNQSGKVVLVGRKQAFCARDNAPLAPSEQRPGKFDCTNQGITAGWEDWYIEELPCQWLDVTDVPPGTYRLEVEVNPLRTMIELDYDNDKASTEITLP